MTIIPVARDPGWNLRMAQAAVAAAICLHLLVGYAAWRSPRLNWDMLAYDALIAEWHGVSPQEAHAAAYRDVEEFASERGLRDRFAALRTGSAYRTAMADNQAAFQETLRFYRTRWLYLAAVDALCTLFGAPPPQWQRSPRSAPF